MEERYLAVGSFAKCLFYHVTDSSQLQNPPRVLTHGFLGCENSERYVQLLRLLKHKIVSSSNVNCMRQPANGSRFGQRIGFSFKFCHATTPTIGKYADAGAFEA